MDYTHHASQQLRAKILTYLDLHGSITNRECRGNTGATYDEAIAIFNYMLKSGDIVRLGTKSGTYYKIAP